MRRVNALGALAALALLAGCEVGPNYHKPQVFSPPSWFSARGAPVRDASLTVPGKLDPNWWTLFGDPELTSLERRVAGSNLDVITAMLRVAESRAQGHIVAASELPTLNADGSYTRERISQRGVVGLIGSSGASGSAGSGAGSSGGTFASQGNSANGLGGRNGGIPSSSGSSIPPFNLWQYGFDANWELDLWGKVRREVESARAAIDASADAQRGALLTVLAEVARDYIDLRGVQAQLAITRATVASDQQSVSLTEARALGGLVTQLDVAQAEAELASARANLPQLEQQQSTDIDALCFLLGQPPGSLDAELLTPHPVPPVPPVVPIGIPSQLLERRPDIRQAEETLHGATADVGVAVASFYPTVTLSGSIGLQALQFKNLGNWGARQYGLGPTISLPIFEGGQLRGTLVLRRAQQKTAAVAFQRTVLQAWQQVEDGLAAYADEQRRRARLLEAVTQNQRALGLARAQYTAGTTDFLNVLTVERSLLQAQLAAAVSTATVSANLVGLYKALGGGWESTFPLPKTRTASAS